MQLAAADTYPAWLLKPTDDRLKQIIGTHCAATDTYPAWLLKPTDDRLKQIRPIPCHVCYSLDSIFCKQLRKLSILNYIHILVYYLQWTYIHIVSIGIQIFKTPPRIFPHDYILLCHVCYIRRFQLFGPIQQSVKFCEVLGLWITNPYCQHCTLLEELYQLNIPWKQVKYNTHNAYQAVSRVLQSFVTCVTRVNWTQLMDHKSILVAWKLN